MNLFHELIAEQLDSVEGPPFPKKLQQAKTCTSGVEMARGRSCHGPSAASDAGRSRCSDDGGSGCSAGGCIIGGTDGTTRSSSWRRGADRAGSGSAALTPPVQTPIIASTSPPLNKLTYDETKSIMTITKGFEASVRKLLKCNAKVDKGTADLQLFAQDTTGTRYPAGIRPFKSAAEMVELDSTLSVQGA